RNHAEQIALNNLLLGEISEIQREALLIREIPGRLLESMSKCNDIYKDALSVLQDFAADDKFSTAKVLSCASEIGTCLFSTLESHFSMAMDDHRTSTENRSSVREQCNIICERLNGTVTSLVLSDAQILKDDGCRYKGCTLGGEIACWKEKLDNEVNEIKEKYLSLEKEMNINNQLLEVSKHRYHSLEREFHNLKEERDALLQKVSSSSQRLAQVTEQKEKVLHDFNTEVQRRKDLEQEIKQFSVAFACRQRSLISFHTDFKTKVENMKAQSAVSIRK
ncbi:unnamed protein product, partial [Ilex paraguariensis]